MEKRTSTFLGAVIGNVLSVSLVLADPVTIDGVAMECDEGDSQCSTFLAELVRLHRETHLESARTALEMARLATATHSANIETQLAMAAEGRLQTILDTNAALAANLEKNSPGLQFLSAEVQLLSGRNRSEQLAVSTLSTNEGYICNALPFVRSSCAIRSTCAGTEANPCPTFLDCQLPIDGQYICHLPVNTIDEGHLSLSVTYSCGGDRMTEQYPLNATKAYITCDLR